MKLILSLFTLFVVAVLAFADGRESLDQGQRAFDKGAFDQALAHWQKALESFHATGQTNSQIQTSILLAGAYQAIGQQQRALEILEGALASAHQTGALGLATLAKAKLGGALLLTRQPDRAALVLAAALTEARASGELALAAAILNDQGNTFRTQQNDALASSTYLESAALARQLKSGVLLAQSLVNAAAVAVSAGEHAKAEALNGEALQAIDSLAPNHQKAFLWLAAAQTDRSIQAPDSEARTRLVKRAHQTLTSALELGEKLEDVPVRTYGLGYLGQLYEADGQIEPAIAITRSASFAAQQAQMPEALYRWQWQLGRLLGLREDVEGAIAAYRRALQTLGPIRQDLSVGYGNSTSRLTFRQTEGPLFFELADLLLNQAGSTADPAKAQQLIVEARDTVEQLKTVELEDYFCDDCVELQRTKVRAVEAVDDRTAVIYVIPLPTRTELLVGLASGLRRFVVDVSASALTAEVRQFRKNLETRTTYAYLAQGQQLYHWLIEPIRGLLEQSHVDTLVFVPDGALRTIPLASLHSGERFLVQDFAIAVAPGLSLVDPRPVGREKGRLLLSGLSQPVQGFPPLNFVTNELRSVGKMYRSDILLDETFTLQGLTRKLTEEQYSIVHIASHGQFDRDVHKTFLLTHDSKLTLNELEAAIRPSQYRGQPVEFLVLSACQTAAGDDRAALGLAGIAVKAGARSALATLWFVNDQSTSVLVPELYAQLHHSPALSKARALQAAQLKLLADRRYRHPCYWSPYLIIGNWL